MDRPSPTSNSASSTQPRKPDNPLHGVDLTEVLQALEKEETTLKNLKNLFLEELERVQLEEILLRRQIENPHKEMEVDTDADESLKHLLDDSMDLRQA
jgi:hypothetical protein